MSNHSGRLCIEGLRRWINHWFIFLRKLFKHSSDFFVHEKLWVDSLFISSHIMNKDILAKALNYWLVVTHVFRWFPNFTWLSIATSNNFTIVELLIVFVLTPTENISESLTTGIYRRYFSFRYFQASWANL